MHPCVDLCKLNVAEDLPHTVVTAVTCGVYCVTAN